MSQESVQRNLPLFQTDELPASEEIIEEYAKEFSKYITPTGDTTFGFWMQTLADLELLDLELKGLTKEYEIRPIDRTVEFEGDDELLRLRIAHLEKVRGKNTLYTDFVDSYNDTNAYAFHNLYPYKGKFYPRVVRTLINAFGLRPGNLLLDPFNGSGTTTHEASIMGIQSVGIDITPVGTILSNLKNDLPFLNPNDLNFGYKELIDILNLIETKQWQHPNRTIYELMLIIYFDTEDAFTRTSRYNKKGKEGLFIEKFNYIRECHEKLIYIREKNNLQFTRAKIIESDILQLKNCKEYKEYEGKFDAIITSPPYYFSIDYVGKDAIAYNYLGTDMKEVESKYLGMKSKTSVKGVYANLPYKVILYYEDLKESIQNMYWALRPGGKLAIIVGDSTVSGKKIPTTMMTKKFCEEVGFEFQRLVFNPLLGARNRAIRGESIIICLKR
ncbi:MAG TPA: DNA methyltransferase [Fervidobacterium sp.]|nr:DNA methyltransferase [Fervidobacterium sp.]HPT54823.1 DNA methyltransferase [Fervidobacterium sp.]HPZ17321.1 DNA methyltransferase [Fervidobacterium sp.]HQE48393.1 DNA methyltransferase [Fervidobacterium sp.]HUM42071.1 DNA methyltransferase [Fervidobacterium sp.]